MAGHVLAPCLVMLHDKHASIKNKPVPASLHPSLPPVFPQSQAFFKRSICSFHQNNDSGEGSQKKTSLFYQSWAYVGPASPGTGWTSKQLKTYSLFRKYWLYVPVGALKTYFFLLKCYIHPMPPFISVLKGTFRDIVIISCICCFYFIQLMLTFYLPQFICICYPW